MSTSTRSISPARRAVKFHVSKSVKNPVLTRHIAEPAVEKTHSDDDDDESDESDESEKDKDKDDPNQSLDSLEEVIVPTDTFDKLLQSYESLSVVGALLAGFALSLLPSVAESESGSSLLSAARLLLALTNGLNLL
jgi:hypothetical protein